MNFFKKNKMKNNATTIKKSKTKKQDYYGNKIFKR